MPSVFTLQTLPRAIRAPRLPQFGRPVSQRALQQAQLQPFLPTAAAIDREVVEQEEETSILQDVLEFPSELFGFFGITDAIVELAESGDVVQAGLEFLKSSPLGFASDAVGLSEVLFGGEIAEKKTFRDIRIAFGDTDPDEDWLDVVLNITGDILLDPATYFAPFAVALKDAKLAKGVVTEVMAGKVPKIVKERLGIVSEVVPVDARKLDELYDGISQVIPGVVRDPRTGQLRQAISLAEKSQSDLTGLMTFKFPFSVFTDANFQLDRLLPKHYRSLIGEGLTAAGDRIRQSPVISSLINNLSPGFKIVDPNRRVTIVEAKKMSIDIERHVQHEGLTALRALNKKAGFSMDNLMRQTMIDALDLGMDTVDDLQNYRSFIDQGHEFLESQARGAILAAEDPAIKKLLDAADFATEESEKKAALIKLFNKRIPLRDDQLALIKKEAREGVEIPRDFSKPPETLSIKAGQIADRSGTPEEIVPFSERVALKPRPKEPLIGRVVEASRARSKAAFDEILERAAKGEYTPEQFMNYVRGLRQILRGFQRRERAYGLLTSGLHLYFPRRISEEARSILDEFLPRAIRAKYTGDPLKIAEAFMQNRTITRLSQAEANAMFDVLGSATTNFNGLDTFVDLIQHDKKLMKKLRKVDPDTAQYFSNDINSVVLQRAKESGRAIGKKQMLDALFDPDLGLVTGTARANDFNAVQSLLREGKVPIIRTAQGLYQSPDPTEVLVDTLNTTTRVRVQAVKNAIEQDYAARLTFTKNSHDALISEAMGVRDLTVKNFKSAKPNNSVHAQWKRSLLTDKVDLTKEAQSLSTVRIGPTKPKIGPVDRSKTVRAVVTEDGLIEITNTDLLTPRLQAMVEDLKQAASESFRAAPTSNLRSVTGDLNRSLDSMFTIEFRRIKEAIGRNREALKSLDTSANDVVQTLRSDRRSKLAGLREQAPKTREELRALREEFTNAVRSKGGDEAYLIKDRLQRWGFDLVNRPDEATVNALAKFGSREISFVDQEVADGLVNFMSTISTEQGQGAILSLVDRVTDWWKRTTVLPFPQSRLRDVVSNYTLLVMGGFKHPSAIGASHRISRANRKLAKGKINEAGHTQALRDIIVVKGNADLGIEQVTAFDILPALQQKGILGSGYLADELQGITVDFGTELKNVTGVGKFLRGIDIVDAGGLFSAEGKSKSAAVNIGARIAAWGDDTSKMSGVIDAMRRGMDIDDAVNHVKSFVWTPGSTLHSNVERYALRRIFPFYNWTRFVTETMVRQYVKRPGSFTVFQKTRDTRERQLGIEDFAEDIFAASMVRDRLAIPFENTVDGPVYIVGDNYLPQADIAPLVRGIAALIPGTGVPVRGALDFILERAHPFAVTQLENALNYHSFYKSDIEDFEGEQVRAYGGSISKKTLNIMNDFRLLKVGRDLGLLDRETTAMLTAHGKDLLTRGEREVLPGGDTASDFIRSLFTSRLTTGPLGFAPKARPINVPMQIAVQGTKNKRRIGELKGGLRRALSEDGPASEENIQITQKLLAEHQATQLRIDAEAETRVGFTFDDFISRVRKQRQFIRR